MKFFIVREMMIQNEDENAKIEKKEDLSLKTRKQIGLALGTPFFTLCCKFQKQKFVKRCNIATKLQQTKLPRPAERESSRIHTMAAFESAFDLLKNLQWVKMSTKHIK
ncbi:hypothetical protein BpHYR1_016993 [Brachionus plicatilis]|uniref:Uncharacterized protein n=1 Tax=Brachionus plicatilis TaxID=10195 RepID=A0A3M7T738_BRAPC|nr:hypothetical protein BpHYR1_016993 [Brachionus plicatilis]